MAKKKKKEGAVGKALRTWSPGKYIGKFIKGEPIGVSEKRAAESTKKAAEKKASRKAKTAKRTEAHKKSVAEKDKKTGGKSWYPGKYIKKFIKGEPIGVPKGKQKADKKKAADKSWKKATEARKAAGGPNLSTLVKSRGMHKKGSSEYAAIQNKINEAYGVKKRHAVDKKQLGGMVEPPTEPSISPQPTYSEGGKVSENNPFGWPTRDARSGFGKKK